MQRVALMALGLILSAAGYSAWVGGSAQAQPVFKKEFDNKYLKKDTVLYKQWDGRSTCNTCHIGGTDDRAHRNAYGEALDKLLDQEDADALSFKNRKKNPAAAEKAEKKIREALDVVEKEHSDPENKNSPTFGDLIKAGKLPVSPTTLPSQ